MSIKLIIKPVGVVAHEPISHHSWPNPVPQRGDRMRITQGQLPTLEGVVLEVEWQISRQGDHPHLSTYLENDATVVVTVVVDD